MECRANSERMHEDLDTINNKKIKTFSSLQPKAKNDSFFKNRFKHFQTSPSTVKGDVFDEFFSKNIGLESANDDLKTIKVFSHLGKPFEDLEKLLSHFDENFKADRLTQILTSSLNSLRPVKSMEEAVEMYQSEKVMEKMAYYFSKSRKVSIDAATKTLKELVKNSAYFKKNIT
jgi:hypothetical protein